jgi:uncharacterized damage-inducible protein DinB
MKTSRVLLALAVALPLGAAEAQNAPAGPPANPTATAFRNNTARVRNLLAQAFDSIPASKFGFKPTPQQLTIGYIAQHLTDDAYFFCDNFSDRKATRPESQKSTPDSVKATWPKAELVAQMKEAFKYCDDVMATMDDAAATAMISVTRGGTTRQVPRINYLIGHAMDLQDHYSQIANYMRLNGILPPSALPRPGRGGN